MNESFLCPLTDAMTSSPCAVTSCMYNKRSAPNNCAHSRVINLVSSPSLSRDELKVAVAKIYRVDAEEMQISLERVMSIVCLNEYFQYVHGKDLLDARPKELQDLKLSVEKYETWRPSSRKIPFKYLVVSIDFVLTHLK